MKDADALVEVALINAQHFLNALLMVVMYLVKIVLFVENPRDGIRRDVYQIAEIMKIKIMIVINANADQATKELSQEMFAK